MQFRERYADRISVEDRGHETPCWVWTGANNGEGYGQARVRRALRYTHILAYEVFVGPVPAGLQVDHLCRVRECCNPEHLEPVTHRENVLRGLGGRMKTHCAQGHEFRDETTYVTPQGHRECRICKRASVRACRARKAVSA